MMAKKGPHKKSIKKAMIQTLLVSQLAVLLFLVGSFGYVLMSKLKHQVSENIETTTEAAILLTENRLSNYIDAAKRFSKHHFVINALIDPAGREGYLSKIVQEYAKGGGVSGVMVVDFEGEKIFSTLNGQAESYRQIVQSLSFDDMRVLVSADSRKLVLLNPIIFYDTPQGAIITEVLIAPFLDNLPRSDNYSYVLYHGDKAIYKTGDHDADSYVEIGKRPITAFSGSLAGMSDLKLKVLTSKENISGPLLESAVEIFILGFFVLGGTIILANHLGERFSAPILRLRDRVNSAKQEACFPIGTGDELEDLAKSFDSKTKKLIDKSAELVINVDNMKAVMKAIPDLVFVASSSQYEIEFVNQAVCDTAGFSTNEILGRSASDFLEAPDGSFDGLSFGENVRGMLVKKDEGKIPILLSTSRMMYKDGSSSRYLFVAKDISELELYKQYQSKAEQLTIANKKLQAAMESKSNFFANMSHEIRTPINGIYGMATLLAESDLDKEQQRKIGIIRESCGLLTSIVDDVLDYSRLEAGKMELELIPFSPTSAINDVVGLLQTRAKEQNTLLEFVPSRQIWVKGDVTKVRQVLMNLVGNAIKFTENGEIKVNFRVEKEGSGLHLHFEVEDNGIGIAKDVQEKLFKDFSQADSSTTRKYGGSGLGLSICKRLVSMMGGQIGVRSVEKGGSTFFFSLFLEASRSQLEGGVKEKLEVRKIGLENPLKILVAEDNHTNMEIIKGYLDSLGFKALEATNGLEALEMAKQNDIDIILMDCMMPVMDGFQATRMIKENLGERVFIAALTASALKEDRQKCQDAGMQYFLSKPLSKEKLYEFLAGYVSGKLLDSFSGQTMIIEAKPARKDISHSKENFNIDEAFSKIKGDFAGDMDIAYKAIETFIAGLKKQFEGMSLARRQRDYSTFSLISHTLKSNLSYFHLNSLREKAAFFEKQSNQKNLQGISLEDIEAFAQEARKTSLELLKKFQNQSDLAV